MKQTLRELLCPQPKSKIKAGDGQLEGAYIFYTSSQTQSKFYHSATYNQPALIFGTGGTASVHFCDKPFSTSTDCLVMYGHQGVKLELIYHYLRTNLHILQKGFKGAGLQHISKDYILDIEIDMPEPLVQEQITLQMQLIDRLIEYRKQQAVFWDEAVKSRFIELFGNFVYDRNRWQICVVGDVADTIDPQPSHRTPPISTDGVPYIGIAECNYRTRLIEFEKARKVGQNVLQEHIDRYTLDEGDFIIGKIGTIGKPFFIPAEQTYTLSANTVLIKPNKNKVDPQYLFAVFQSEYMDRIIDAEKKSTSQPAFGIQKVRRIEIPMPPIELQEQFAAFVEQTDKSKYYSYLSYKCCRLAANTYRQEWMTCRTSHS